MLERLRKSTNNMGPENIIARHVDSPLDMVAHAPSFRNGDISGCARGTGPMRFRRMIWKGGDGDLCDGLALEREMRRSIPATLDCQEGNTTFQDKRLPRLVGK